MPQPQSRQTLKSQQRPPRLRSACNQCNAVKLKCSGERDGCTRCRTLRVECIYAESRVGKVQGNKRKKKAHEPLQDVLPRTIATHDQSDTTVTTNTEPWTEPWISQSVWNEDMLSLDDQLNFEGMLDDSGITSSVNTSSISELTSSSSQPTELSDFGPGMSDDLNIRVLERRAVPTGQHNDVRTTSLSLEPHTSLDSDAREPLLTQTSGVDPIYAQMVPADRVRVPDKPKQDFAKLDSRCVLACTKILITLENYLLSELRALDLILATVSKAVDDLKRLVELQQQSRCDRCIILFTTVMLQVMALLEAGSECATNLESDAVDDILADTQPGLGPSLYFGAFLPSSEEQRSWRSRIITKEVRHIGEILSSVMVLARLGSQGASSEPAAVDSRLKCLGNIEQRLKDMIGKETGGTI